MARLLDGPVGRPEVPCSEAVVSLVGGVVELSGFIVPETAASLCVQLLKLILSLKSGFTATIGQLQGGVGDARRQQAGPEGALWWWCRWTVVARSRWTVRPSTVQR